MTPAPPDNRRGKAGDSLTAETSNVELDLGAVDPVLRDMAAEAFRERDVLGLLCKLDNTKCLDFVIDNMKPITEAGMFEPALVQAITGTRTNNSWLSADFIRWLFSTGDREKFRGVGVPIPDSGPVTVYRGVAGHGPRRRLDGCSWTTSLSGACWFANRFGLANPAILTATVDYSEVLCHWTERDEDEFIVWPERVSRLKLSREEISARAAERDEKIRRNLAARINRNVERP